jgi:hypothetical protein
MTGFPRLKKLRTWASPNSFQSCVESGENAFFRRTGLLQVFWAAIGRNRSFSRRFYHPDSESGDNADFFEQKGTKKTKEEFFFVAFVCFCAHSVPRAARVENSESVQSVPL